MCGRFTQDYTQAEIQAYYDLIDVEPPDLQPSWNVAPTQQVGVVVSVSGSQPGVSPRRFVPMRWGLTPGWADSLAIGARMINARAETVASKPAFRAAFRQRRCVIPARGFFEWKRSTQSGGKAGVRQPFYVSMADARLLSFAGLWESWRPADGPEVLTCTIITTGANAALAPIHDRMPVILSREGALEWLRSADVSLLRPCPPDWLSVWPVSTRVNSPRNNDPGLIVQEPSVSF